MALRKVCARSRTTDRNGMKTPRLWHKHPECEPVALVKRFVTNLQMLPDISKALIMIASFTI